ncbi:MAG: DUF5677 domain-containing protein [Candidatus Acidiferrum sp.]
MRLLIERLEHCIDTSAFIPATRYYRGVVVLGLISKALTVGRAVCALVDAGFPGEAFGLTRTLIDIYFTVRYFSNGDAESRAERFAMFFAKDHEGWTKIIQKYYPGKTIDDTEYHRKSLESAREYKNPNQWTGLGDQTKQMALEDDAYERDSAGIPIRAEFDYEVIYKWTSHYVHATVSGIEGHFVEAGVPYRIRGRIQSEAVRGDDALFNTLAYVSKIIVCAFRAMHDEQPEEILKDFHETMKLFAR